MNIVLINTYQTDILLIPSGNLKTVVLFGYGLIYRIIFQYTYENVRLL